MYSLSASDILSRLSSQLKLHKANAILVDLAKVAVLSGSAVAWADGRFGKRSFSDTVGDIDVFLTNASPDLHSLLDVIRGHARIQNVCRLSGKEYTNSSDKQPEDTSQLSILELQLEGMSVPFQLIRVSAEGPTDVINSFDANFVQIAVHKNAVTRSSLYQEEAVYLMQTARRPKRFFNQVKKGFGRSRFCTDAWVPKDPLFDPKSTSTAQGTLLSEGCERQPLRLELSPEPSEASELSAFDIRADRQLHQAMESLTLDAEPLALSGFRVQPLKCVEVSEPVQVDTYEISGLGDSKFVLYSAMEDRYIERRFICIDLQSLDGPLAFTFLTKRMVVRRKFRPGLHIISCKCVRAGGSRHGHFKYIFYINCRVPDAFQNSFVPYNVEIDQWKAHYVAYRMNTWDGSAEHKHDEKKLPKADYRCY